MTQRNELLKLLQKFEELFDVTLGPCKIDPVDFELNEDTKPICSQPYPVPKAHKEMLKQEIERLVLLGFLEVENDSEWRAPYFAQPEPK